MTIPSSILVANTDSTEMSTLTTHIGNVFYSNRISNFFSGLSNTYIGYFVTNETRSYTGRLDYKDIPDLSKINAPSGSLFIGIEADSTTLVDGITADFNTSIELTIAHELVHALVVPTMQNAAPGRDQQYLEQIAVFGANAVYGKLAGEAERVGHLGGSGIGVGLGSTSQIAYISADDSISFHWSGDDGVFSTVDGAEIGAATGARTDRTYWRNISFDGVNVRNYITVDRDTGVNGMPVYGPGSDAMTTTIASQSVISDHTYGFMSTYLKASGLRSGAQSLSGAFGELSVSQHHTVMVANERFADGEVKDASGNVIRGPVNSQGPSNDANGQPLERFFIIDTNSMLDTLLIGGGSGGITDVLKSGGGHDVLAVGTGSSNTLHNEAWGGAGDDILIGSAYSDRLEGGDDDDVLSGGGGSDVLSGGAGTDMAYFGDLSFGIVLGPNGGFSFNIMGTTLDSIEIIYGTQYHDLIYGNGSRLLFGGLGTVGDDFYMTLADRAIGSAGADNFYLAGPVSGMVTGNGGADKLWSLNAAGSSILIGASGSGTIGSLAFTGISEVHGYTGTEIFNQVASGSSMPLYGEGGADTFNLGANAHAYGGSGDDTFVLTVLDSTVVFDGGLGTGDKLDLSQLVSRSLLELDLAAHTLKTNGLTFDVSSFEDFDLTGNFFDIRFTDDSETIVAPTNPAAWYGRIDGRGGNDTITGGEYDMVYGGTGNDTIHMGSIGFAYGGDNNDTMDTTGQAMLYGEGGNDTLTGSNLNSMLNGGDGDDSLYGNGGSDQLWAGFGNNYLDGGSETDFAFSQGGGRGQTGGVRAIFQNNNGDWIIVKSALNADGSHQVDVLHDVEQVIFDTVNGYQDSVYFFPGYSYTAPDFIM